MKHRNMTRITERQKPLLLLALDFPALKGNISSSHQALNMVVVE
jgi:hypothetical protein